MILCSMCNKKFNDRRTFGLHLSRSHVFDSDLEKEKFLVETLFGNDVVAETVELYCMEKFSAYDMPIDIRKFISLLGIKRTSKQERATERYKTKYVDAIKNKYGVDNISKIPEVKKKKEHTCSVKHGCYDAYLKQHREYMSAGFKEYSNDPDRKMSQQNAARATYISKFGYDNPTKHPDARRKNSESQIKRCSIMSDDERREMTSKAREMCCHHGGYSSKPEKRVRKALIDLNVESEYNVHKWHYNFDMVVDNIIIEVQGVMWHAKPDRYNEHDLIFGKLLVKDIWEKDRRKQKKAKEEGFSLIEIWEDEIDSRNDEELASLLKERLELNGYEFYC